MKSSKIQLIVALALLVGLGQINVAQAQDHSFQDVIGEPVIGVKQIDENIKIELGSIYGVEGEKLPILLPGQGGILITCKDDTGKLLTKEQFSISYSQSHQNEQVTTTDFGNIILVVPAPNMYTIKIDYQKNGQTYTAYMPNVSVQELKWTYLTAIFILSPTPDGSGGIAPTVMLGSSLILNENFSYAVCDAGTANALSGLSSIPTPANSGSLGFFKIYGIQNAGNYDLAMTRSDSSFGRADKIPVVLGKYTSVTVVFSAVPYGTVPLTIARSGENIKIMWNRVLYGNTIKLYALTGDGTGQFSNSTGWQLVTISGNEFANSDDGYIFHSGQVGSSVPVGWQNYPEAYYKGLREGIEAGDQNQDAPGKTNLEAAWPVGKMNLDLYGGWNLISAPFMSDTLDNALGLDFKANEQVWKWDDPTNKFTSAQTFSGTKWVSTINVEPFNGYWLDLSGTVAGTLKKTTIIGSVIYQLMQARTIYAGWDLVGNPFPKQPSIIGLTAGKSVKDDQIWIWDNPIQKFVGTKNFDGTNWSPDSTLTPGRGYWYNHLGLGFEWQVNN